MQHSVDFKILVENQLTTEKHRFTSNLKSFIKIVYSQTQFNNMLRIRPQVYDLSMLYALL